MFLNYKNPKLMKDKTKLLRTMLSSIILQREKGTGIKMRRNQKRKKFQRRRNNLKRKKKEGQNLNYSTPNLLFS